ncbi:GMP synthase [Photobacterium sp. MCCC 1A19761]|uniref:type 1 glutamine amidotransferase n=1 Tax=Photobacterium sp. MCCC 1A19761 TaxID=3115000 RepID=UPI00307EB96E
MRIGVLLCDDVRQALRDHHGNYPEMFTRLFSEVDSSITLNFYRVTEGQYPQALDECDGYITSGSRFGVNDEIKWIRVFESFVHQLYAQHLPFVGICFGHQMIARALGGEVCRAESGWGLGLARAELNLPETRLHSWLTHSAPQYALLVSHQDQIVQLPPDTRVLAGSQSCPYAMILVGTHFLGIQGHPEFTPTYLQDLITLRHSSYPPATVRAALESLAGKTDHLAVTQWLIHFIKHRHLEASTPPSD